MLSLLMLCVELLKVIRARRHFSTDGCWGAYLVLGGIWILFRVKVFGEFPTSKPIAKVDSLGGEESAWNGNVLVLFGEEG